MDSQGPGQEEPALRVGDEGWEEGGREKAFPGTELKSMH